MTKHKALISLLLFLVVSAMPVGAAAVSSYEIYTLLPGDTRENLASRNGLKPEEIVSIDEGLWQAGKRVALMKRYSEAPPTPPPSGPPINGPRLASVVRASEIRAKPGSGKVLYSPPVTSKVIVLAETTTHYGVMMADSSTGWVEKAALTVEAPLDSAWLQRAIAAGRPEAVQEAYRYLGMPYRYGGHLPYDTDCSLLIQTVYLAQGIRLPRTAAEQCRVGLEVALNDVRPGDRLYFINSKGNISHTGMFIGAGYFIHASSNRGCVAVDKLAGSYLRKLVAIRR